MTPDTHSSCYARAALIAANYSDLLGLDLSFGS